MRSLRTAIGLTVAALAALPGVAQAHGPVAPTATSNLAKVTVVPGGVQVKVVDGDQRLWLRAWRGHTVVIRDYRGAPYLRFSRAGVQLNRNSEMAYLNHVPAQRVPRGLTAQTPPRWQRVSGGHSYGWHDGRLHALATVARAPGQTFLGSWSVPVTVDGRTDSIAGNLWHADDPSLVWLWLIVVIVGCVLAARRARRRRLDAAVARGLALVALAAITTTAVAKQLHGRPDLSLFNEIVFAALMTFVAWGLYRVIRGPSFLPLIAIAFVAIWEAAVLVGALFDGFVLGPVPAFWTRLAAVLGFGCGIGLLTLASRASDAAETADAATAPAR
jgi:hypothetical protein